MIGPDAGRERGGLPRRVLDDVRSTSGIASKTFSRNRLPVVTSVTFCRVRRGSRADGRVVRRPGHRRGRSGRGAGRPRPRFSGRAGWCRSPGFRVRGTTSIGSSSRSSSSRHSAGLVRGVDHFDQDLVADRVEQAAPGLQPGDAHVPRLLAPADHERDVLLAGKARPPRRTPPSVSTTTRCNFAASPRAAGVPGSRRLDTWVGPSEGAIASSASAKRSLMVGQAAGDLRHASPRR